MRDKLYKMSPTGKQIDVLINMQPVARSSDVTNSFLSVTVQNDHKETKSVNYM